MFIFYIKDPYGLNEGIYTIQKYIKQMKYEPFNDRIYFMCTNGQYTGEDELSSLIKSRTTKKEQEHILIMISNILRLGRELNMRIIVRCSKSSNVLF